MKKIIESSNKIEGGKTIPEKVTVYAPVLTKTHTPSMFGILMNTE